MTARARRRSLTPLALALGLWAGVAPNPAGAQQPEPPVEGASEGRPFDGYFATGCLVGLAMFIVCKSARR